MKTPEKLTALLAAICAVVLVGATAYLTHQRIRADEVRAQADAARIAALQRENEQISELLLQKEQQATQPVVLTVPQKNEVEEVFSPADADAASKIDTLKKRYEEALASYFVLKKCGRAQDVDFHIITSALAQEMASLSAPSRLQYDVLTSAQGSYREMFSANACNPASNDALEKSYRTFVDTVAAQFMPR